MVRSVIKEGRRKGGGGAWLTGFSLELQWFMYTKELFGPHEGFLETKKNKNKNKLQKKKNIILQIFSFFFCFVFF